VFRYPRKIGFNPYVHGARGLFAALILVFHIFASDWPVYPIAQTGPGRLLMRACEYGVELFYCVSGYVITQALARSDGTWAFLRDRAIRIVPLLWIVVPVSGALGLLTGVRQVWSLPAFDIALVGLANMLALPGLFSIWLYNPATWSLSYEMLFYVLCALWLVAGSGHRRQGRVAVAVIGGAFLLFYPRALPFVVGVLVGLQPGPPAGRSTSRPGLLLVAFLLLWATIQAVTPDGVLLIDTTLIEWNDDLRLPLAIAALCCLLFGFHGLVGGQGHLRHLLTARPMQFLGTISYSFYLWQNVALGGSRRTIRLFISDDPGSPLVAVLHPLLTVAILIPLAAASHWLIEDRFTRILRRRLGISPVFPSTVDAERGINSPAKSPDTLPAAYSQAEASLPPPASPSPPRSLPDSRR